MESNKDEAIKCIDIAKGYYKDGDYARALKFAKKSQSLYPSLDEADSVVRLCETKLKSQSSDTLNGDNSQQRTNGEQSRSNSNNEDLSNQAEQERTYTEEHVAVVQRILQNKNDYYGILQLDKSSSQVTEAQIKKSYRKIALQVHPDKNGAPNASEAFKLVGTAFQVLSNDDKRRIYDQFGVDGLKRGGPSQSSPFSSNAGSQFPFGAAGGTRGRYAHYGQDEYVPEMSPEDIFNMFFGGMTSSMDNPFMSSGGFGGAGVTIGLDGRPRIIRQRHHHPFGNHGGMNRGGRRRGSSQSSLDDNEEERANAAAASWFRYIQFLPFIIVIVAQILNGLISTMYSAVLSPSGQYGSGGAPSYSFHPSSAYNYKLFTQQRNVPYYVNPYNFPQAWMQAKQQQSTDANRNTNTGGSSGQVIQFEKQVEEQYISALTKECKKGTGEFQRYCQELERISK
ncbi:hypothetical protein MIR68_006173 [Amoeboaphelidium protococcarum]|nr:hypothetical protein MIR68_006173 [Amoeboaphelidium protococcarum]